MWRTFSSQSAGRGGRLSLTHFMPPTPPPGQTRERSWPWPEAGSMVTLRLTRFRISLLHQAENVAGLLNANSFAQSGVCSGRRQRPARRQRHGISHDPSPDARRFPGPCPWSGGRQRPASTSLGNGWPRQRGAKDHNAPPGQACESWRAEAGRGAGGAMATQPSHSHYRGRGPRL